MSKPSAQCEELRSMAASVGLAIPQAATLMMKAADTIDRLDAGNAHLRELVELEANVFSRVTRGLEDENANLHTQVSKLKFKIIEWRAIAEARGQTIDRLGGENAKLRELCKDMMAFVEDDDACERCGHDAECVEAADGELVLPYEGLCLMLDLFADRMRELGIEVDE